MNRFDKVALSAVIIVALLFGRSIVESAPFYLNQIDKENLLAGIAGWAASTFGPLAIAVWFWRWAKRVSVP